MTQMDRLYVMHYSMQVMVLLNCHLMKLYTHVMCLFSHYAINKLLTSIQAMCTVSGRDTINYGTVLY